MKVSLIQHSSLSTCVRAIRTCWDSHEKGGCYTEPTDNILESDKKLLARVILKHKHGSTAEHLTYTFDIDGVSRALLQEQSRHRIASISVKSTRYTLKELKEEKGFVSYQNGGSYNILKEQRDRAYKYIVATGVDIVDDALVKGLEGLRVSLVNGISNDIAKYSLPEAYKTSYVWTVNARSLQNFLSLRTDKSALWEIRDLANEIFKQIPEAHKYLFEEFVKVYNND